MKNDYLTNLSALMDEAEQGKIQKLIFMLSEKRSVIKIASCVIETVTNHARAVDKRGYLMTIEG